MRRFRFILCCSLLISPAAVLRAQEPDKPQQPKMYHLKDMYRAGDVGEMTQEFAMTLTAQARVLDQESPAMPVTNRQEHAATMTILAVDAKGRPTAERLKLTRSRFSAQMPQKKKVSKVSPAEGKTLTLKKAGGRTTASIDKGKLTATDRRELSGVLNSEPDAPFPDYDVLMGEEWNVESPALARELGSEGTATVTGKLVEEVMHGGHPCVRATLHIEGTARMPGESSELSMKLDGDIYYALDLKRTIAGSLSGPVMMTGDIMVGNLPVGISGDGTAKIKFDSRWRTAGAKPAK